MTVLQTFACSAPRLYSLAEIPETTIAAKSRGQARAQFFCDIREVAPDLKFTDIRVRRLKSASRIEDAIARVAKHRSVPFARLGMRVQVGEAFGQIVGTNSSANFDVLFEPGGRYANMRLNCHPCSAITYFDDQGNVIASFDDRGNPR